MNSADYSNIHRYLDEAFLGVTMTPEIQDLKEEIRGNLAARAAELTESGFDENSAALKAVDELGDIRELVAQLDDEAAAANRAGSGSTASAHAAAYLVNRVRPKPALVVGVVIASVAATAGLVLAALGATGVLPLPIGAIIGLCGLGSTGVAWIVGDCLAHETTTNHPMPPTRAGGYFFATLLTVYGLAFGGLVALSALALWGIVFAAIGVVAGIVLFAFLGATQTNRKKRWAREAEREYQFEDRFSQDPVAAARFGIYTAVLWLLAFAAFVVLSLTVGFVWSWLALLVGFAAFMFMLARMLFPADNTSTADKTSTADNLPPHRRRGSQP